MEKITETINQYNNLMKDIKKEFKEIYKSNRDLYSIINEEIDFLNDKIENLKQIKDNFSLQRQKLITKTNSLEEEVRFSELIGRYNQTKNNIISINKMFIEDYLEIERQTQDTINYFNSNLDKIKKQMNKGEIKNALNYLKEINEVFKNGY